MKIFNLLHASPSSGHFGFHRTLQRFERLYWFSDLRSYVQHQGRRCRICQQTKSPRYTLGHTNLIHNDPSVHPVDTVAVDTFGPLPTSDSGNRYIMIVQCLFSHYVVLSAVSSQNGHQFAHTLVSTLFAEHGIPRILLSDNGQP